MDQEKVAMDQEKARAGSLTRIEWYKIFDLVQAGDSKGLKAALPGRNRTTRIRAYKVARELIKLGKVPLIEAKEKQIADKAKYSTTEKFVSNADSYYRMWLQRQNKSEDKIQHLRHLNTLVSRIRNSIVNPDTESRNYPSYISTWRYGGQDWRLTISSWAMLMLPYLDDEQLWSKPIPIKYLYEHIKSSPFKQHYDRLNDEIGKFKEEFFDVAKKIKEKNPQMIANWDTLNDKLDSDIANYKPMHGIMLPDDIEPLLPNFPFYADILELFKKRIVDLDKRYIVLEDLLQQLYDDLDKDTIQDVIKKGSCDLCRAKPDSNRKVA